MTDTLGRQYAAARGGREPAEALPQYLRWQLVAELHGLGMTDQGIAEWTRTTLYTTARIRHGLGLAPNAAPARPVDPHAPVTLPLERTGRQDRFDAQLRQAAAQHAAAARQTVRRVSHHQTAGRGAHAPIPGVRRAPGRALPNREDVA